jgi:DNA gyrase subunit B
MGVARYAAPILPCPVKNREKPRSFRMSADSSPASHQPTSGATSGDYGADKIQVLEGMAAVRKRPGMYIGDPGANGLYQLVWETVDNSIDEALAGHCTEVLVTIHPDNSLSVSDNGRGIPVAPHPSSGKSTLEVVLTILHAGGKFDNQGAGAYKKSGGLHGVGVSCVNAVSAWLIADVKRDGKHHRMRFERGEAKTGLQVIGPSSERGTTIQFKPDVEVFGDNTVFDYKIIAARLRELAFLNSGVRINLQDLREEGKAEVFYSTDGLAAFVRYLNQGKDALHPVIHIVRSTPEGIDVELAIQYNDGYDEQVLCFANNIRNRDGGTHLEGFKTALTREFNAYAKNAGLIKGDDKPPAGEDLREGLCAIVSVKLGDPKFSAQTKDKLINIEIAGIVQNLIGPAIKDYCEENPKIARSLIGKAIAAMEAREAARKARDLARKNRKSLLNNGGMPDKLRDCQSRDVHETEIFLVEGDSAGGSAKRGSDARIQAILPLKGKIINVEKARIDKVMGHSEISAMIQALGTGIGEEFNLDGLRYGKIVIMTDADVDGSHIRTLLLTFFFRQMPRLIENGNIYVAQPPLYKVTRGKSSEYVYNEKLLNGEIIRLGSDGATLTDRTSGRERAISGAALSALVEILQEFDEHDHVLSLKGLTIDEYLALRNGAGALPLYRARLGEAIQYLYSEAELDELLGRGKPAEPRAEGEPAPIVPELIEFTEREAMERSLDRLRIQGFNPEYLLDSPGRITPFMLRDAKEEVVLTHLHALVPAIKRFGQRGLDIQRYKGLGEMNPDQLWETTMDPTARTLLRVNLSDAIEAERMFATLMGNDVAIRRDFIERYALSVAKRIDV